MTAQKPGGREDGLGLGIRTQPAQGAGPVVKPVAGQIDDRRGRCDRETPEPSSERGILEVARPLLAQAPPKCLAVRRPIAAEGALGRRDSAFVASQAQIGPVAIVGQPRQRPGLPAPAVHPADRFFGALGKHQGPLDLGTGRHLQGHLQQQPQGSHRADHQPGHIEAGDVLHHSPAKGQHVALAVDHAATQHTVPNRPGKGPARPG